MKYFYITSGNYFDGQDYWENDNSEVKVLLFNFVSLEECLINLPLLFQTRMKAVGGKRNHTED